MDLVMWSGGLDSTWTIQHLNKIVGPVYTIGLTMMNGDNPKRGQEEKISRKNLVHEFDIIKHFEAGLDTTSCELPILDTFNCVYITAQYARMLGFGKNDNIWMGVNADEENDSLLENRQTCWDDLIRAVYRQSLGVPNVTWIHPAPTRVKQLIDLGPLADLTYSCRDGTNCGECTPCTFINEAKSKILNGEII